MTKNLLKVISLGGVLLLSSGVVMARGDGEMEVNVENSVKGNSTVVSGSGSLGISAINGELQGSGGVGNGVDVNCGGKQNCTVNVTNDVTGDSTVIGDGVGNGVRIRGGQ